MNKIIVIVAMVMFLKPIFPVIEYVANYDYISKTLCVNKDKPMMHCNGKCHLMKELAKQAESEKPISSDKKQVLQEFEILFFQDIKSLVIVFSGLSEKHKVENNYSNFYIHLNNCSVFHPPIIS